jgi:sigma-B regulation protein RsbU (phosphoserine phosphatase)
MQLIHQESIAAAAIAPVAVGHPIVVLLVDDQPILGRAMQNMLETENDIQFHFCREPLNAVALAETLAPTVIIQDLTMPDIDGLSLLKQFRANPRTCEIPMIVLSGKEAPLVKAQAFALGANDYLVKLPDRVELIARIRHHSRGYIAQVERNEAYRKLAESERQMATEIIQAAAYVQSLLPAPIKDGPIRIDWRFVPSTELGGDAFGYQWLDAQHMAFYLLDVSGHGVGAALLAVSVLNTLSHRTLPQTDFHDPAAVMHGLNQVFSFDKHGGRFFTIWYGVYAIDQRKLTFSGGGHPPALLFCGRAPSNVKLLQLTSPGPPIGVSDEMAFTNSTIQIPNLGRLFLYSDGVVEVGKPVGEHLDHADFIQYVAATGSNGDLLDQVLDRGRRMRGGDALVDDCSLMLIDFA